MESQYAPAERSPIEIIKEDFLFIQNAEYIEKIINSLPYLGAILNDKRQVVFANKKLLELFNIQDIEQLLGQRPGEFLSCINANNDKGGCGTSIKCSVCGAVNCILQSQHTNQRVETECRITTTKDNKIAAHDFRVTTVPFISGEFTYYVFSLVDISDIKRRQALEKIFFHDVINKTGSMYGLIDLLKQEENPEKRREFIDFIAELNKDLTDEILSQRELSMAENGELSLSIDGVNSLFTLKISAEQIRHHDVARGKEVNISPSDDFTIMSDPVLLKRILMNMIKNALEASSMGQTVTIGSNINGNSYRFWVHNEAVMSKKVKLQLFHRSFSTKGSGRGLGTYSIRLFGENYLKGSVNFTSEEGEGTMFFLDLPASI